MDFSADVEYVYYHATYNAVIEAHMRACPTDGDFLSPDVSPLCKYLTGVLSAANWMIVEGENGETILQFMSESLVGVPSAKDYMK